MHVVPLAAHAHPRTPPLPAWAWVAFGGIALGLRGPRVRGAVLVPAQRSPPIRIAQASRAGSSARQARAGGWPPRSPGGVVLLRSWRDGRRLHALVRALAAPARHARGRGRAYGLAMYVLLFRIVLPTSPRRRCARMPPVVDARVPGAYAGIGMGCAWIARASSDCTLIGSIAAHAAVLARTDPVTACVPPATPPPDREHDHACESR
jgi:hypothetical protein